jgi:hypothetical protein
LPGLVEVRDDAVAMGMHGLGNADIGQAAGAVTEEPSKNKLNS